MLRGVREGGRVPVLIDAVCGTETGFGMQHAGLRLCCASCHSSIWQLPTREGKGREGRRGQSRVCRASSRRLRGGIDSSVGAVTSGTGWPQR
eukprot:2099735-Rhodomonas_salina.2